MSNPIAQKKSSAKILVVDDKEQMRDVLRKFLLAEGYAVEAAASAKAALEKFDDGDFDLVLSDIKMPGMDGTELLAEILRRNSRAIVILMTAFGSIEAAVEAIKFGATDYVSKPFQMQDVLFRVARALKEKNLEKRVADLENEIRQQSAAPLNFTRTIFALCAHARQDACAPRINIKKFYKQSLRRHKKWQQQHKI